MPVCGCDPRDREPYVGLEVAAPPEAPEEPDDTRDVRDEAGEVLVLDPESDVERPLTLEPLRDEAEPDRLLEELGVRDPDGGGEGGWTRDSDPPPDEEEPVEVEPEEPDDPDDVDPDVVGRGIACAANAAGAARAIVTATTISERGNLSISMHSLRTRNRQGGSRLLILQQYCHSGPVQIQAGFCANPASSRKVSSWPGGLALRGGRPYDASSACF